MLIFTSLSIRNENSNVKASFGDGELDLDYRYIFRVTEQLSKAIFEAYNDNDLPKGRAFGSKGEQWAANKIATRMKKIGLYDPTENINNPHHDELEKNKPELFRKVTPFYNTIISKIRKDFLDLKVNDTDITEFFISPSWGQKNVLKRHKAFWRPLFYNQLLSKNYSYNNLDVIRKPYPCHTFLKNFIDHINSKFSIYKRNFGIFILLSLLEFQKYYDISFMDLNEANAQELLPFYNDTYSEEMISAKNDYVLIEENPSFFIHSNTPNRTHEQEIFDYLLLWKTHRKCKGIIRFDNNSYVDVEVFDNALKAYRCLPTIFINKSLGNKMYKDPDNHSVNFTLDQEWTNNVRSFNVIGQINGTDASKTVVIGCLYDSWWNQGTADSAIGIGIMLAIAKYMKELENLSIRPKYNVKFIAFSGEEYNMRGAYSYEKEYRNESIVAMIDLNQLGFKQDEPKLFFNIVASDKDERDIAEIIFEKTNFIDRMNNTINFASWTTIFENNPKEEETNKGEWNYISDYRPFDEAQYLKIKRRDPIKILSFVKARTFYNGSFEYAWGLHHRDGQNHNEGDSINYYAHNETNITAEVIWNFTKFYTINPNCSFTNFNSTLIKTNESNTYPDTVNISFSVKSRMPHDRILVRAILWYQNYTFFRRMNESNHTITSSGLQDNLIINLPEDAPSGKYTLWLFLYNSTGEILNDKIFYNSPPPYTEEWDMGYYSNDSRRKQDLLMGPPNNKPGEASQPSANSNINIQLGTQYFYTAGATDPEGDQLFYQWDFGDGQLEQEYLSSYDMFNSGTNQTVGHIWTSTGEKQVRVRAIDKWYGVDRWGNWSEPLNVSVGPGCGINVVSTNVLVNQNVNFSGINYEFDFKQRENPTWDWEFGNGNTSTVQNTSQTYNKTDEYVVNLSLDDGAGESVNYSILLNVVNLSAEFNIDHNCAQPNINMSFTNQSISVNTITNWSWNFGDGNTSYDENPVHNYPDDGDYDVTLTVTDGLGNSSNITKVVHVDSVNSLLLLSFYSQSPYSYRKVSPLSDTFYVGLNSNITFYADPYDDRSDIDIINVSITNPFNMSWNYTMTSNSSHPYRYEYVFNNTSKAGWYNYTFWVKDKAGNLNSSPQDIFMVSHLFGYPKSGDFYQDIDDRITGSVFTVYENGTADKIYAYIQTNLSNPPKTKCMIYNHNGSELIGTTQEKTVNTGENPEWIVYNFTGTKPTLVKDNDYILVCWGNDTSNLYYDNCSNVGRYNNSIYEVHPDPDFSVENRLYSIFCYYSTKPKITNVVHTPGTVGFGFPVNISANVYDNVSGIESVSVNISYPINGTYNMSMTNIVNDTYEFSFTGTWLTGTYNYSIRAVDRMGGVNCSSVYNFTVLANAMISICTIKDSYGGNETINITDPPAGGSDIGYKLLDEGNVLQIWNKYDNYYFNTSSGIQLTNHYDEYWSHNVLMLGYYNNNKWNLIYRTDELSGFNKNISTDNETYVNVTIWKNLAYKGYDFRLAIRYHLGVYDNELTVIPYIKNIDDENIPYVLGFGWEMKDIQIDMTASGDYINVNRTMYYLNQTLDNTYTNLIDSEFYLMENITNTSTKSLYLKWNESLPYKLQVKSRTGQYNAPVTLFIRVGTLDVGQEKFTEMYWYDADQKIYYFDNYNNGEAWATNPSYMVDGITSNYASTTLDFDVELCDSNNCTGVDKGGISRVELRCYGYYSGSMRELLLRPIFNGTTDGFDTLHYLVSSSGYSSWYEITDDPNAPGTWSWANVTNLDCDVEVAPGPPGFTLYCSLVEVRVTYQAYAPPVISNPIPADDSIGVSLTPTLNITVSDANNDTMNITWYWYNNETSLWYIFGTNNGGNGTYSQNFSNATVNGKWWYWKVNVSDGINYTVSDIFRFYTGYQSKIKNTGSTNISGYLSFEIQYYNVSSEIWEIDLSYDHPEPTIINSSEEFGLDTIFNGNLNSSDLSRGNGSYRVFVSFKDDEGNVLKINGTELIATYVFTVTFT